MTGKFAGKATIHIEQDCKAGAEHAKPTKQIATRGSRLHTDDERFIAGQIVRNESNREKRFGAFWDFALP